MSDKNGIRIFNSPQFGDIRTAGTSEQPLFCLADVCKAIGIANARKVTGKGQVYFVNKFLNTENKDKEAC